MRNKKLISICLLGAMLIPQVNVQAISNKANNNIQVGDVYSKKVVSSISRARLSDGKEELLENDEKLTEKELELLEKSGKDNESYEVLVPKTESNYEVTLSNEDGSYTYEDSADTYDEAVEKAKIKGETLEKSYNSKVVVPTVINNSGQVVYATLSIARSWKERKYGTGTKVSYVYEDSNFRKRYTYIADGYISEMPIVQENENEAKVLVSGYEGWLNKNIDRTVGDYKSPNRDIRIQPITDVTNPCYYIVDKGFLVHHISTKMDGWETTCNTIGIAPSYLKEGQRYYSYDGNYFYDGSQGIATGLSNLTRDLQIGSHGRAVNANNPYYNYYEYLPFRSTTRYTAEDLNRYIDAKTPSNSKLRGLGQAFIDVQNFYGVNALIALGISMNESARGGSPFARNRNNLFGLHATDDNTDKNASYYDRPEDSMHEFSKDFVSRGYADPSNYTFYGGYLGNKKYGANVYYASDPYWADKATSYMLEIERYLSGGDVSKMKDYNYYQLLMYSRESNVVTAGGNVLYPVRNEINKKSSNVGAVVACTGKDKGDSYEIFPDRTSPIGEGRCNGFYEWNTKGYINKNAVKLINQGRNLFADEDINMDGKIDSLDLALLGASYNKTKSSNGWNSKYDINGDGIIDIYDIVRVSCRL